MRNALTRAHEQMNKFIAGSYDIGLLCSNMQIEAHGATYNMDPKILDFESLGVRHEGKIKLVPQMRNTHTSA